ncbi:MAG: transcription-repair coupling factor [Deltaproteobacteria bacterium]|nr:transcription-repair coupling factor [Deltaproteobacteria bacterium]
MQHANPYSLSENLSLSEARIDGVVERMLDQRRIDLSGLPPGAAALVIARIALARGRPVMVLTPDRDSALRTSANCRFFIQPNDSESIEANETLFYPAADVTPFVDVVSDRRTAMDRLSVLAHLANALPLKVLVLPVAALLRRIAPGSAIARRCLRLCVEQRLDRDNLIQMLVEAGYLRAPVVEDPGTFAVRGFLIDIFPPCASHPARVELADDVVLSIKRFDPDSQRTLSQDSSVWIHPVREMLLGAEELMCLKQRVYALCDELTLPSSLKRQLVDDLQAGRMLLGSDAMLPACYPRLESLFDLLPDETAIACMNPNACIKAVRNELHRANHDRLVKQQDKAPIFPLESYYLSEQIIADKIFNHQLVLIHELAVGGEPDSEQEPVGPLNQLDCVAPQSLMHFAASDQRSLISELNASRSAKAKEEPLAPLVRKTRAWLDEGLRLLFTARTKTQAERLATLLRSYDVPVAGKGKRFDPEKMEELKAAQLRVVVGELRDGFVLAQEALVCVTEEEIFGERRRRQPQSGEAKKKRPQFDDLRQLDIGDYVVHVEHGVGRYLGLERKLVPLSRLERLQGKKPFSIEVLVVEYAGGDRLFIPVTRLSQLGKFASAEGAKPRLDRLGGQTFANTKSRVRNAVRKMADDLLSLYAERAARTREPLPPPDRYYTEFEATFPFEETPDQTRAIDDVLSDLQGDRPMERLICGDVGFGKTEVALRAAFRTTYHGRQVALLCPTTVLAQQHYLTFRERLRNYPLRVEVLSRFVAKRTQADIIAALKQGSCDIVIGTHRLLSRDVHFKRLGLLVVDEEQRFGVAHKERIKKFKTEVDVLTLSATPIPRTLQMAVGGFRELSLIATPPVDRRAIRTFVSRWDDHLIREAVLQELSRSGQVFLVHNRIQGLYERSARLQQLIPEARVATAHGQMREASLERVMTDFVDGRYDVLCSTAIIENGLDIPRANTILIDRADLFGMSQLYQLRGRVGRSNQRAYCYLLIPSPNQLTDQARFRIEALERFSQLGSGFQLASLDMELRGAGELLGSEQSGTIAAIGFDLFIQMLQEAIAELKGETVKNEIDPEINLDIEHYLPEEYISDVGIRLAFYKRFSAAPDEQSVSELAAEMEDRFGLPHPAAIDFVRAMALKPALRDLRVLGCEATSSRVTLHFSTDAPLDPARIMKQVARSPDWRLTPDLKLTKRYAESHEVDAIDRIVTLLREIKPFLISR